MSSVCLVSIRAAAQAPTERPASKDQESAQSDTEAPADEAAKPARTTTPTEPPPPAPPGTAEVKAAGPLQAWQVELHGYFRAPISMGISSRPNPDTFDQNTGTLTGPPHTQVTYGPNRTVDSSYYSFAYTRLQEQDWAEVFTHIKRKHVDAAVGWMGYWLQGAAAARNYDAAWAPGLAYLTLDTDFEVADLKPNVALTVGAFWPKFGYFEKYDTYTLGRYRQAGEELTLTVPKLLDPGITLTLVQGFGTGRDGIFSTSQNNPLYASSTALDLITYEELELSYKNYLDVAIHYSTQWTADPQLASQVTPDVKTYGPASQAHLTVLGAEASLRAPHLGHLWISPSFISVRNGWALGATGTEVMHSLGGSSLASNYLGFTGDVLNNTGSGSVFNLGFLYENTLSGIQGKAPGNVPDVTLNVFGLLADASIDLPANSTFVTMDHGQASIKQFKYGADVTIQAQTWLAFMLRGDLVNYDLDHPGYIFAAITPRAVFSSHFLSGESIYIQYSRYFYGDNMVLAGTWPWNTPLVAGADILQNPTAYLHKKPDEDVVKLQATVAF
jgi:hypothetical protein